MKSELSPVDLAIAAVVAAMLFFLILYVTGCSSIAHFHDVQTKIAACEVTDDDQVEALDVRTGFPFLSTPHRYTCFLDENERVVWRVENEAEASLESIIDNPIGAAIQKGIPSATVPY